MKIYNLRIYILIRPFREAKFLFGHYMYLFLSEKWSFVVLFVANVEILSLWGPQSQLPEASGLHDTNLNTLSTQAPRGQKLHGCIKEEWQIIAHEKGFKFHAQP